MTGLKSGSTVVEHSTHEPKFEGSNPATAGLKREKIEKLTDLKSGSTLVEHLTHEPKFEGSKLATAVTGSEETAKN